MLKSSAGCFSASEEGRAARVQLCAVSVEKEVSTALITCFAMTSRCVGVVSILTAGAGWAAVLVDGIGRAGGLVIGFGAAAAGREDGGRLGSVIPSSDAEVSSRESSRSTCAPVQLPGFCTSATSACSVSFSEAAAGLLVLAAPGVRGARRGRAAAAVDALALLDAAADAPGRRAVLAVAVVVVVDRIRAAAAVDVLGAAGRATGRAAAACTGDEEAASLLAARRAVVLATVLFSGTGDGCGEEEPEATAVVVPEAEEAPLRVARFAAVVGMLPPAGFAAADREAAVLLAVALVVVLVLVVDAAAPRVVRVALDAGAAAAPSAAERIVAAALGRVVDAVAAAGSFGAATRAGILALAMYWQRVSTEQEESEVCWKCCSLFASAVSLLRTRHKGGKE